MLYPDDYFGASLLELVRVVGTDTMLLWYALLTQRCIMFLGHTAHQAGGLALACPLLVSPLRGFSPGLVPNATLNNLHSLVLRTRGQRITGATHPVVREHQDWYDLLIDIPAGRVVHATGLVVTGSDMCVLLASPFPTASCCL